MMLRSLLLSVLALTGSTGNGHLQAIAAATSNDLEQAILACTAWEEGRYCHGCSRGDKGTAVSTYQIHAMSETQARQLETDPYYAARYALWLIRESFRICPDARLAPYAGGCKNAAARKISERRMALARRLVDDRSKLEVPQAGR